MHLVSFLQLVCGGLAGSTAALFTTPFDVVKTRLQTQVLNALSLRLLIIYTLEASLIVNDVCAILQKPGSVCQYSGVFHALQEISTREGVKGLYRYFSRCFTFRDKKFNELSQCFSTIHDMGQVNFDTYLPFFCMAIRGLTPRLFMYITQGALFFASYEFFKRLFNLNEPQVNGSRKEQYEKGKEDRSRPLDIPLRLPSSSASAASS